MRTHPLVLLVVLVGATAIATAKPEIAAPAKLALPGGDGGIGFDDLMFSPALHRVLAPAGRTGKLDLIDPNTRKVESRLLRETDNRGVMAKARPQRMRTAGVRSGRASNRRRRRRIGDCEARATGLRAGSAGTRVWVTEPGRSRSGLRADGKASRGAIFGRPRVARDRRNARPRLHAHLDRRERGDRHREAQGNRAMEERLRRVARHRAR